jgi:hypothetical protein
MAGKSRTKKRKDEHIVRFVASLPEGTHIIEHPDGRLEWRKGETDWKRLDALTDEESEASIANNPDWAEFKVLDWSDAVLVISPKKKAISICVDADLVDYLKRGRGLQAPHERGAALLHAAEERTSKIVLQHI